MIAVLILVVLVLYRSATFQVNYDAFAESTSRLNRDQRDQIEQLVEIETLRMVKNEEEGLVYYHSPEKTGKRNRVYLLWMIVEPGTETHRAVISALPPEKRTAPETTLAVVAYIDLGFHGFRTRYEMLLSRCFKDGAMKGIKASCYRRDTDSDAWIRIGQISEEAPIPTAGQKRTMKRGTYNLVVIETPRASRQ